MTPYTYLSIVVVLSVVAQLVLKAGAVHVTLGAGRLAFVQSFLNRYLMVGYGLGLAAPVFYFLALRQTPLGIAYAFMAMTTAFVAFFAHVLWDEPLGRRRVMGIVFIVLGNILFGLS